MSARKTILVTGDPQAEALATILRLAPEVAASYEVVYAAEAPARGERALWFEQRDPRSVAERKNKAGTSVTFPLLRFELLWPLTCPNAYNRPEPGYPFGRFPYGDKFVSACLDRKLPPEQIVALCNNPAWGANWPNLDEVFRTESRRLTAADAACDVALGAHILKQFRKQRLFWTADHPTDVLLAELARRVLAASRAVADPAAAVAAAIQPAESGGLLGIYAVPIHPHIAEHFALTWFEPDAVYRAFDREYTYAEYFADLVRSSAAVAV